MPLAFPVVASQEVKEIDSVADVANDQLIHWVPGVYETVDVPDPEMAIEGRRLLGESAKRNFGIAYSGQQTYSGAVGGFVLLDGTPLRFPIGNVQTAAFQSDNSDAIAAISGNPTATASNYHVASGTSEVISLGNVKSQRVVGVTTGSTTTIDFPEGTGSPFEVGDSVELTGISPTGINTSYAIVSSIDSSSGYSGYFDTRIVIDWDTSGQGAVTAGTGELREVFKVAGKTSTGTGTLYVQQVQVSGVA